MKDVRVQMLMLSSQNAQHQAGALVNVLIFVFMYSLKRQTLNADSSSEESESFSPFSPWSYCRPGYISPSPSAAPGWSGVLPGDWRCCHDTVPPRTGPLHCHLWWGGIHNLHGAVNHSAGYRNERTRVQFMKIAWVANRSGRLGRCW